MHAASCNQHRRCQPGRWLHQGCRCCRQCRSYQARSLQAQSSSRHVEVTRARTGDISASLAYRERCTHTHRRRRCLTKVVGTVNKHGLLSQLNRHVAWAVCQVGPKHRACCPKTTYNAVVLGSSQTSSCAGSACKTYCLEITRSALVSPAAAQPSSTSPNSSKHTHHRPSEMWSAYRWWSAGRCRYRMKPCRGAVHWRCTGLQGSKSPWCSQCSHLTRHTCQQGSRRYRRHRSPQGCRGTWCTCSHQRWHQAHSH